MRKEIIFAIIAGSIFGLVIAFGIWRINSSLSPRKGATTSTETPKQEAQSAITIAEPSENDVLSQSPVLVSGITTANALVAVSAETKDYLVQADNKGKFELEVALIGGVNQIVVTSFDKDTSSTQVLTVIYSTEFAKFIPEDTPEPSESTDSVRQKVQQKVDQALNSPTSYLGSVTDISSSTIQLKSASGEIQQVSTADEPTVIKDGKTPKEVKLTDVAIGDFIIAMGFRNGNHVLTAKRILITSPVTDPTRKATIGTVSKLTKSGFSLGETAVTLGDTLSVSSFDAGKITKIRFANLENDERVIVLGESTKNGIETRSIFLLNTP